MSIKMHPSSGSVTSQREYFKGGGARQGKPNIADIQKNRDDWAKRGKKGKYWGGGESKNENMYLRCIIREDDSCTKEAREGQGWSERQRIMEGKKKNFNADASISVELRGVYGCKHFLYPKKKEGNISRKHKKKRQGREGLERRIFRVCGGQ